MKTVFLALLFVMSSAASSAAEIKESAHLVVTGGPNAGTWDASTDRGGCTYGFAGPGSWGNQLSSPKDKDPKKFNSLQLIVPDSKKAAKGTDQFYISVGFGPLLSRSAEYKVDTRTGKGAGKGTVTVEDHGSTAKVSFSVTTDQGVRLQGTIDCRSVMRAGS